MRIRVVLKLKNCENLLPFDHQYYLASCIYRALEKIDPSYALELHMPRRYKFFTFSYLMSEKREIKETGILIKDQAYFFVASPNDDFIKLLVEGILLQQELKIGPVHCIIEEIKILKTPKFEKSAVFKTLSPILIRKPVKENRKLRGKELYPTDSEFEKRLATNLVRKYREFYGDRIEPEISFRFTRFKPKRHKILNTYHRCILGEFTVKGDEKLIEFGYECGFGEKNSMGFGMVKALKENI